ncbi:MAG: right-handed parallel beta-helix repeat-containing protein [Phycisphaeraceae bacterium]|nr:right-handed parallel beta-helix repeat-containing protein [Phycisphaeraceae bacterium]
MRSITRMSMAAMLLLSCGIAWSSPADEAASPRWQQVFEDRFAPRSTLGPKWLVLRGPWQVDSGGEGLRLDTTGRAMSFLMCEQPLWRRNVRVTAKVWVGKGSLLGLRLQAGAMGWGAGGPDDRVGVDVHDAGQLLQPRPCVASCDVTPGQWHDVTLTLVDGVCVVRVDGWHVGQCDVKQARNPLQNQLQCIGIGSVKVKGVTVATAPMSSPPPAVKWNDAATNRHATVMAQAYVNDAKPDAGLQAAIDALPPTGGVVALPAGRFVLRRYLELQDYVTLAGQGGGSGGTVLTLSAHHDLQPGDAVGPWGYPGDPSRPGMTRLLVESVRGGKVTLNQPSRTGLTERLFPMICSYESLFADIRDLTIRGTRQGTDGQFENCPITLGLTSQSRVMRVCIDQWNGDGISVQAADDARVFDCTVSGTQMAIHPGSVTAGAMIARNLTRSNVAGLFYCWYNERGLAMGNHLDNIRGYPDHGDAFNILAGNRIDQPLLLMSGRHGVLMENRLPWLSLGGIDSDLHAGPLNTQGFMRELETPMPGDAMSPGGFVAACNTLDSVTLWPGMVNVVAMNRNGQNAGAMMNFTGGKDADSVVTGHVDGLPDDLPMDLLERLDAAAKPALPAPVIDGREVYDPSRPDCGFQAALDELGQQGRGTLLLPGGRYPIAAPLLVPSGVTLSGYGCGSVLVPVGQATSAIIVQNAKHATVRDLLIEGGYGEGEPRKAAIVIAAGSDITLDSLDIAGFEGEGVVMQGRNLSMKDCRVITATGVGVVVVDSQHVTIQTSSVTQCGGGVQLVRTEDAMIRGCLSRRNRSFGFQLDGKRLALIASSACDNLGDGVRVDHVQGGLIAANMVANNARAGRDFAGIHLAQQARECRVVFNNCGDDQRQSSQTVGIREDEASHGNDIRFNAVTTMFPAGDGTQVQSHGKATTVKDNAAGVMSR